MLDNMVGLFFFAALVFFLVWVLPLVWGGIA